MKRLEARLMLLDSVQLEYTVQGPEDGLGVLFVPGPASSWRSYLPVLDALPDSVRAAAVSPRGHGDSAKPEEGYSVPELANNIRQVLQQLEFKRAVLVGHSGSALVVRQVARSAPRVVAGLVLEGAPVTLGQHPEFVDFLEHQVATLRDPIDSAFIADFAQVGAVSTIERQRSALDTEYVEKIPAHVWRSVFAGLLEDDDENRLAEVTCPVLLAWGDADPLVDRAVQDRLLAALPDARLSVYHGAGHNPRMHDPQRFAREIVEFMAGIDA